MGAYVKNVWKLLAYYITGTHKVRLIYKNGTEVTFTCKEFDFEKTSATTTFTWASAWPEPLLISPAEVETIWKLR